jgi:hypothetical protein
MCTGNFCIGICAEDAHCAEGPTFTCQQQQYYSDLADKFGLCWPRQCDVGSDCADLDGTFCRALIASDNEVIEGGLYWDHVCWWSDEGDALPGEACSNADDNGDPEGEEGLCQNTFMCLDGSCSTMCAGDADCPGGTVCSGLEYNVEDYDFNFPLNVCLPMSGSGASCSASGDCGEDEVCTTFIQELEVPFTYTTTSSCQIPWSVTTSSMGEACNSESLCGEGFCFDVYSDDDELPDEEQADGVCSGLCNTGADCGQITGPNGDALNGYCTAIRIATVGTEDTLDDIFAPQCVFGVGSSASCEDTLGCTAEGEACVPLIQASLPSLPASTEWLCLDAGSTATLGFGEECEGAGDCASSVCVIADDADTGYCSAWCRSGEENAVACPDTTEGGDVWACTEYTLLERADEANGLVVERCEK